MKNKRRDFLKMSALTGLGLTGANMFSAFAKPAGGSLESYSAMGMSAAAEGGESVIGLYGPWAVEQNNKQLPSYSFRNSKFKNREKWQAAAKRVTIDRMGLRDIGGIPEVKINKQYTYDGLQIEEITWQLPYGRPTEAIVLKPIDAKGPLPGILAFHDHGGNKYFGTRKITKTSDDQHPLMKAHQDHYYAGAAWANEVAKRGYVVMVSDSFTFASRRVMLHDVPERLRQGLTDANPEDPANVAAYNKWAGDHAHTMAKSLFCAGTTWPGVFYAEDVKALDVLCARKDVDATRIGCSGLSGGGLRTVFSAGLDPRIKCAVPVGFMSTWNDFALNKTFTHTWMAFVPLLPRELDFPEILGLRVPLPTLVLNDSEDQLYTLDQMKEADNILKQVYQKAGAEDHYKCSFYPGLHKFDREMQKEAFDWFDRWLKA